MCNAHQARHRLNRQCLFETSDFSDGAESSHLTTRFDDCDASRVVAAVFEAGQPFNQDWKDISIGDSADNATHAFNLLGRDGA
jgi:hypothetical protein